MQKIFCVLGILLLGVSLNGQTLGTITGEIRDASGAVIPAAPVTAVNTGTNAARNSVTTDQGLYSFPGLVPGSYEVRVEVPGFRTSVRQLTLEVQQTARVDFKLEVGDVTTAVDVSATAAMLTTENATVGTVIENRRIVELPLNGRNFLQLVALSPNVSYGVSGSGASGRVGGDRANQNMSISGMRTVWNNYTLDGVPNNDPNINSYVVLPSVDFLQEFKVQTGIYPAEFGRAATQINVSTKGGTNEYHGSLYEFIRNDKFDAKSYAFTPAQATQPKNPFQWNQYGFTFGGPVVIPGVFNGKDRLFFNSNFERFRQRTRPNQYYTVPSNAMRQGDFSELSTIIYDPEGRTRGADGKVIAVPFAGNKIPLARQSFQTGVLWEFWPAPNKPSESPLVPDRNFYQVNRNKANRDQFNLRFDFIESYSSSWFGRYSWSDEVTINQGIYQNGSKLLTNPKQYVLSNTRTLTPTVVNEFRFGITQMFNTTSRELAYVRNVIDELKIPGLSTPDPSTWGLPRMEGFSGYGNWGDDSNGPYTMNAVTFAVSDSVSLIRGRHSLRFGGEVRRDRFNQLGNEFGRGSFNFGGFATQNGQGAGGYSVADFYLGYVGNYAEAAVANAFHQFRSTGLSMYFDDSWRVSPTLTISAGLRYEVFVPWTDRSEHYVNLDIPGFFFNVVNVPDMALHPTMIRQGTGDFYEDVPLRYLGVQVARDGRLGNRLMKTDTNDFAPRLGIAWSPTSKWSVRAGAGLFYSVEITNPRFDMARTLAGRTRVNGDREMPATTMENFLGGGGSIVELSTPYTWAAQYELPTTFSVNYILNVQRQLSETTMLEIGYVGSSSRRLQGLFDANAPIPGISGSPSSRAPFPEFGVIQMVDGNGRGTYHGASIAVRRRMAAGLSLMASYTRSKSIDTVSGIRGQGDAQNPNDSRCLQCEKAVSGFNMPSRFVTSLIYELPFGRGKAYGSSWNSLLEGIAGGWQVSSIFTMQSGRPGNPTGQGGRSGLAYTLGERVNATGQSWELPDSERSVERWFNTNAFQLQPQGTVGNAGRNVIIGPGQKSWDFSGQKNFRIREGHTVNFRVEAFNFTNMPVWGSPSTGWGSSNPNQPGANYGKIRSTANSMRQLQLGLKYTF